MARRKIPRIQTASGGLDMPGDRERRTPTQLSEEEGAPGEDGLSVFGDLGTSRIADLGRRRHLRGSADRGRAATRLLDPRDRFVFGMSAYVGGYADMPVVTTEPLRFVGDLLYTLGWALLTGVVVVVFSSRSFRRQSGVNTSRRSMPRGSAARQGPSRRRRGIGERRSVNSASSAALRS